MSSTFGHTHMRTDVCAAGSWICTSFALVFKRTANVRRCGVTSILATDRSLSPRQNSHLKNRVLFTVQKSRGRSQRCTKPRSTVRPGPRRCAATIHSSQNVPIMIINNKVRCNDETCVPCDVQSSLPSADGCFVSRQKHKNYIGRLPGMVLHSLPSSDLSASKVIITLKCDHENQDMKVILFWSA